MFAILIAVSGMSVHLQEIFKKAFTAKGVKVAFAETPTKGFKNGVEEPLESPEASDIEMARFAPPEVETFPYVGFETAAKERILNLSEMLAGRTRKESARMFFEILVILPFLLCFWNSRLYSHN